MSDSFSSRKAYLLNKFVEGIDAGGGGISESNPSKYLFSLNKGIAGIDTGGCGISGSSASKFLKKGIAGIDAGGGGISDPSSFRTACFVKELIDDSDTSGSNTLAAFLPDLLDCFSAVVKKDANVVWVAVLFFNQNKFVADLAVLLSHLVWMLFDYIWPRLQ